MKRTAIVGILCALCAAPALAQAPPAPGGPAGGPPPEVRQHIEVARSGARTQAMNALSGDHQAKVNGILNRVKAGQLTDPHDAAQQIDAILSRKEARAVIAAHEKLITDIRGSLPGGPDGAGFAPDRGPGGPGPGFAPGGPAGPGMDGPGPGRGPESDRDGPPPSDGGRRMAGHAMHSDAGFALLVLNLDREQMRSLLPPPPPPR